MLWAYLVVGLLTWAGATLILQGISERRSRPDLAERLIRFHQPIAEEAERWLRSRVAQDD